MKPAVKAFLVIITLCLIGVFCFWQLQQPTATTPQQAEPTASQTEVADPPAQTEATQDTSDTDAPSAAKEQEAQPPADSAAKPVESADNDGSATAASPANPTCNIKIDCSTILDNMDKLTVGKADLVPDDGLLLSLTDVGFTTGDTAFDLLQSQLQSKNMHLDFSVSPAYGSVYIKGIGNLYEFDCGPLSGWEFSVNGKFQPCACSEYILQNGDLVFWQYTCDLGADIGNDY